MKKYAGVAVFAVAIFLAIAGVARAGEIDILVQKLVQKGVLSGGEAQAILTETKEEARKQIAQGKNDILPAWLQTMKMSGDLRLRYQSEDDKSWTGSKIGGRDRARLRFRLGIDGKVNDQMTVGAGLASGAGEPRSTNQTVTDTFSGKAVYLDYMYVKYAPFSWMELNGGKMKGMKSIHFQTSDLLWDTDINPEGVGLGLTYDVADTVQLFANSAFLILDEATGENSAPFVWFVQPGLVWKPAETVKVTAAVAYYDFENLKNTGRLDWDSNTNTKVGLVYKYDYNCIAPNVKLSIKEPFGSFSMPYIGGIQEVSLFGDWVKNTDLSTGDTGYLFGAKIGASKINGWGDWALSYGYRRLERDAFVDAFPDSDAYNGYTNIKGHETILDIGLTKNTWLSFDYYNMRDLTSKTSRNYVMQADWNMKF